MNLLSIRMRERLMPKRLLRGPEAATELTFLFYDEQQVLVAAKSSIVLKSSPAETAKQLRALAAELDELV